MFTANAAGLKLKVNSLRQELKHVEAGIFTIQESHFRKKGKIAIAEWEIFEAIRNKAGGGTMIGVKKALEPILVEEYSGEIELLVVEAKMSDKHVRIMLGYGPQETWPLEQRLPFFEALEEEITKAGLNGTSVIISFYANSKLGTEWIPKDQHK